METLTVSIPVDDLTQRKIAELSQLLKEAKGTANDLACDVTFWRERCLAAEHQRDALQARTAEGAVA